MENDSTLIFAVRSKKSEQFFKKYLITEEKNFEIITEFI